MTSKRRLVSIGLLWPIFIVGSADAQQTADPWMEEAQALPICPQPIELRITLAERTLRPYAPLLIQVTLTNRSSAPLELDVRDDGLPHRLASRIDSEQGSLLHHQWIGPAHSIPSHQAITIPIGGSTTGEMLALFGGPPSGVALPKAGRYEVSIGVQPDPTCAPVWSNKLTMNVPLGDDADVALIHDLREIAMWYYGRDEEAMMRAYGEQFGDYEFGVELLAEIIRAASIVTLDEETDFGRKRRELFARLEALLVRHDRSSYSPYIARYLGLVQTKTFERQGSLASFDERNVASEERQKHPSYIAALKYLSMAAEGECWPRTLAPGQLGRLHLMAHDWEKAETFISKLRTDQDDIGGSKEADRLSAEMNKYRAKLARREESQRGP